MSVNDLTDLIENKKLYLDFARPWKRVQVGGPLSGVRVWRYAPDVSPVRPAPVEVGTVINGTGTGLNVDDKLTVARSGIFPDLLQPNFGYFAAGGVAFGLPESKEYRITSASYDEYRLADVGDIVTIRYVIGEDPVHPDAVTGTVVAEKTLEVGKDIPVFARLLPLDQFTWEHDRNMRAAREAYEAKLALPHYDQALAKEEYDTARNGYNVALGEAVEQFDWQGEFTKIDFASGNNDYIQKQVSLIASQQAYALLWAGGALTAGLNLVDLLNGGGYDPIKGLTGKQRRKLEAINRDALDVIAEKDGLSRVELQDYYDQVVLTSTNRAQAFGFVGEYFGSQLGQYLVGTGNDFGTLVASSFVGSVGAEVGRNLLAGIGAGRPLLAIQEGFESATNAIGISTGGANEVGFGDHLQGAVIGAASTLLTMELSDALGLEGLGAEAFGVVGGTALGAVLEAGVSSFTTNGVELGKAFAKTFDAANVRTFMGQAVGAYIGQKLASLVVSPETQAVALFGGFAGAAGAAAVGPLGLSSLGFLGANSGTFLAITGWTGVGTFVGIALGTLIGNLFSRKPPPPPQADAETYLNFTTGYYEAGTASATNGGNLDLVRTMSESARDILNSTISLVTGGAEIAGNANEFSPSQIYGHTADQIWVKLTVSGSKQNFASASDAVEYATNWAIRQTKIVGGDIFLKRAIYRSRGDSISAMTSDFQTAEDFGFYVMNQGVINEMITQPYDDLSAADKSFYDSNQEQFTRVAAALDDGDGDINAANSDILDSSADVTWYNANKAQVDRIREGLRPTQIAASWIVTLQRANELELDTTSKSDFYGGFGGFSLSVQMLEGRKENVLTHENLSLSLDGTTVTVSAPDAASGAPSEIFVLDNFFAGGGFHQTVSGPLNAGNAVGRSLAEDEVNQGSGQYGYNDVQGATFIGGSAQSFVNSDHNDFVLYYGSDDLNVQDTHTENWSVHYNEYDPYTDETFGPFVQSVTLTITGGDDIFITDSGNDVLKGFSGYDWLDGGAGDDILDGGTEDDVLLGGAGVDQLYGREGDDYLSGGAGDDTIYAHEGNDTLVGGAGNNMLQGHAGDDTYIISSDGGWRGWAIDTNGENTNNYGSDTVSFERFEWGVSTDLVGYRPAGWDSSTWWVAANQQSRRLVIADIDGVNPTAELGVHKIENLTGSSFDDSLTGNASANILKGGRGDDELYGADGDDTLEGGAGADLLDGGAGNNTASYAGSLSAVWVDLTDMELFGGDAAGDAVALNGAISTITNLTGSDYADTFKGDGQVNRIYAGKGDDWIIATDAFDYYYGEEDFDTVDYSEFGDGVTVDLSRGGLIGTSYQLVQTNPGSPAEPIFELQEIEVVQQGVFEIEHVVGSDFDDELTGRADSDDYFTGGVGDDLLSGGTGNDTYIYNRGDGLDTISGELQGDSGGYDVLVFGDGIRWSDIKYGVVNGEWTIGVKGQLSTDGVRIVNQFQDTNYYRAVIDGIDVGGVGVLNITAMQEGRQGTEGNDINFFGHAYRNDFLITYAGDDVIYTAQNATASDTYSNMVIAGRGDDIIHSGTGDDQFVFEYGDGADTIYDDGGSDTILFGPDVLADDLIYKATDNGSFFIGLRDYSDPSLEAHQVADRIEFKSAHGNGDWSHGLVEYVKVAGSEIDITKLDIDIPFFYVPPPNPGLPVAIDIDGDGLELIRSDASPVAMRNGATGAVYQTGWLGASDGWLALDRDGSGAIDDFSEISFVNDLPGAKTDLEGLAAYDSNGDGSLTVDDAAWSSFVVWRDANTNGIGGAEELTSLSDLGITSISLELSPTYASTDRVGDNVVLNTSVVTFADGLETQAHDVALHMRIVDANGRSDAALSETDPNAGGALGTIGVLRSAGENGPFVQDTAETLGDWIPMEKAGVPPTPTVGFDRVVVDIDRNGLSLVNPDSSILERDLTGDGAFERLGWIGGDDAFLAIDRDGDGEILFETETDFSLSGRFTSQTEGLLALDTSGDGQLSSADAQYAQLRLWIDADADGAGSIDEVLSLAEAGLQSLELTPKPAARSSGALSSIVENELLSGLYITWSDGMIGDAAEIGFKAFLGDPLEQATDARLRNEAIYTGLGEWSLNPAARRDGLSLVAGTEDAGASIAPEAHDSSLSTGGTNQSTGTIKASGSELDGRRDLLAELSDSANLRSIRIGSSGATAPQSADGVELVEAERAEYRSSLNDIRGSRWWTNTARSVADMQGMRSARLTELFDEFDAAREASELSASDIRPANAGGLDAERQRLLEAIASFRGSSGASVLRRPDANEGEGSGGWLAQSTIQRHTSIAG